MRQISSLLLAFSLLAAPAALAASGKDACCAGKGAEMTAGKKCDPANCKDAKKCDPATCKDNKKCTPEEKAKCAAAKDAKAEAPKPPKS